jgi:hypothetical protein
MSDVRSTNLSLSGYSDRFLHSVENTLRNTLRPVVHARSKSISELLAQIEETTTPVQLTKLVNKLQARLFKFPAQKQSILRKRLVDVLTTHVSHASETALRTAAAEWLRMFVQAGLILQPEEVFVTLVTAIVRITAIRNDEHLNEQQAYLKMIFDCFWPYRYPYPAYNWEAFPANDVFYPLAPLLLQGNESTQDILISIFNELPTLDDEKIAEQLLPVALKWASDADSERRRRITHILCKLNHPAAQEALLQLQQDTDPLVTASAKRAAECIQQA